MGIGNRLQFFVRPALLYSKCFNLDGVLGVAEQFERLTAME